MSQNVTLEQGEIQQCGPETLSWITENRLPGSGSLSLTLKRAQGVTDLIPRAEIDAVTSTGLSLMPEGLEKGLTPQDLADLMAFVKSIQGAPPAPGR